MTTAMITACFTGLYCAVCIVLTVINSAEFILSPYLSAISGPTEENRVTTIYPFKNISKLTARAVGFIFFIHPVHYHSTLLRRNGATRKDVIADPGTRKLITCL